MVILYHLCYNRKQMSKKLQRVTHLSTAQGASEKRPQPYYAYGEDVSQLSNAVMCQEHLQHGWPCRTTGRCGE